MAGLDWNDELNRIEHANGYLILARKQADDAIVRFRPLLELNRVVRGADDSPSVRRAEYRDFVIWAARAVCT